MIVEFQRLKNLLQEQVTRRSLILMSKEEVIDDVKSEFLDSG